LTGAVPQKPRQGVVEILDFMRKHGLTLSDLIDIGGAELKSPNPKTRQKARLVEKCWSLMARLSLCYAHLEAAPAPQTRQNRYEHDVARVTFQKSLKTKKFLPLTPLKLSL
jgi:hypothetical protein